MKTIPGGVTAPKGYRASGVAAGIKPKSTKKDCALIASDAIATVAGMFTKNVMKSPPVVWNQSVCAAGCAQSVFINSGNANAATGESGAADVRKTADLVADALGTQPGTVCLCSTGVIGVPLPMDRIAKGVVECAAALSPAGSADAAAAIMTTDTVPKEVAYEVPLSSGVVRMGAIAKGSGMIAPNMGTMICVITTDATIAAKPLANLLRDAVNLSFNCISVDNDMSTSDTVLCFANSAANLPNLEPGTADYEAFGDALTILCRDVARRLVLDGEGATKFVEIVVEGTSTDSDAKTIARAIAFSHLCKTAFFGEDPNWGRIVCAAGYAGVPFDPNDVALWLDEVQLVERGAATDYRESDAAAVMKKREFRIRLDVGTGPGQALFWTSDLSNEYVRINADYRS
ncbi:MAG: bifunctional glutamate N-acetyltransferase/amino-acid acetyltransferase ArgJ [Candidatus Hydrogenedentes bacterium]|nr:bifunctional glutamate N-acetyltransferase/amino-acid acetyltransferase ArgJ [Candidatus Hydrogenedentota bacterium]